MSGAKNERANEELLSLTAGYCNGTLSADELARLEHLLLNDADARFNFRRYLGLDAALRDHGESAAQHWNATTRSRNWKTPPRMLAATVIAIIATVGAMIAVFYNGPATAIATLEQVTGDVRILGSDGHDRAIASDSRLGSGDIVRTRGNESSTVVAYEDGTRLTLVGNTTVTYGDRRSKSSFVHQGTLAASVQPQPQATPLLLATPLAQVQVLGARFQIEALANRTDLTVTEGRVRVVRTSDGKAVDVSNGEHAVVTDQSKLLVQDIPSLSASWEVDFEHGLPDSWDVGELVMADLPPGSHGGVKAVVGDDEHLGTMYKISSNEAWLHGLFAVHKDSHLHITFKMENPKWINLLLVTRTADPHEPQFSGNYLFKELPRITPAQWQTLSIPLARFERIHSGDVPLEEVVPYKLTFFSDAPDRGLVIDRMWVTPDGPGDVVLQRVE